MATYRFWIPRWRPASLNRYVHRHWGVGHRLKRADRNIVAGYFLQSGIPRASGKRKLEVEIVLGPRQRQLDETNLRKSLEDALVECGALVDDSPATLVSVVVSQRRAGRGEEWGTEILLEDVT